MNTQPNQRLAPVEIVPLLRNRERLFWQSRAMLRDPPQLVDLQFLAKEIRRAHN